MVLAGPQSALDRSKDQRGNDEESGDADDHSTDECVSHVSDLSDPTESFGVDAGVGHIQLEECVFHCVHHRIRSADEVSTEIRSCIGRVHHRLLGNGWCQRPAQLDCSYESICETCVHFSTDTTFQPVVLRQRDHAAANNQTARAELFNTLLAEIGDAE